MVLPVSGALHAGYQLAQDRWSYWSGMGFALLAGGAFARLLDLRSRGRVSSFLARSLMAGAAVLILILGVVLKSLRQDISRQRKWSDKPCRMGFSRHCNIVWRKD